MSEAKGRRRSAGHKILEILERRQHLGAEAVYRQLLDDGEAVGLATVYRELARLEKAGLVVSHRFDGRQSIYEPASDDPHDHIICIACQRIVEFSCEEIAARREAIATSRDYAFVGHRLVLFGLCPECRPSLK